MSVIDLSKVDEFLYEFHNVCKDLDGTVGKDNYYDILGRVFNSAKFNIQYDLGNILENIKDKPIDDLLPYSKEVQKMM